MILAFLAVALASPEGKPGAAASGCTCHGDASDRTAVTLSSGAQAVDPGDTVELQVYVQSDVAEVAGVTFATSDGDLLAGENTASSRGDIVQPEPVPLVEGSARFTFSLLVPESDTTVRVYGAGNAANAQEVLNAHAAPGTSPPAQAADKRLCRRRDTRAIARWSWPQWGWRRRRSSDGCGPSR